jgi:hypothetical protein
VSAQKSNVDRRLETLELDHRWALKEVAELRRDIRLGLSIAALAVSALVPRLVFERGRSGNYDEETFTLLGLPSLFGDVGWSSGGDVDVADTVQTWSTVLLLLATGAALIALLHWRTTPVDDHPSRQLRVSVNLTAIAIMVANGGLLLAGWALSGIHQTYNVLQLGLLLSVSGAVAMLRAMHDQ